MSDMALGIDVGSTTVVPSLITPRSRASTMDSSSASDCSKEGWVGVWAGSGELVMGLHQASRLQ